jgi:hypothetical protein
MTRLTVSTKSHKKQTRKQIKRMESDNMEINHTLKLAARGYGTSHRTNVDGDSLAQNILMNDGQGKKKGLFFLCC